jgi:NACHT domain
LEILPSAYERTAMEPLTALSLASAVLQIVNFSHDMFMMAKRIAKDGSPDANLADNVAHLLDLLQALEDKLLSQQKTKLLTKWEQHVKEAAQKCFQTSKDLIGELDKVKWRQGPGDGDPKREHRVYSQTWKLWWAKSKIERLQKEMRGVEQTLQLSMLADMYDSGPFFIRVWLMSKTSNCCLYRLSKEEATSIQQKDSFKDLDYRLQEFINQHAKGNQKLSKLVIDQATTIKDKVSLENTKTRDQIAAQLQWQESARSIKNQCDTFLSSLVYNDMTTRKSQVTKSHEETCHWIFDNIARPWGGFLEWLKSGDQIYWVSGKPGSGKSTLMKFLVDDDRTKDALRERGPGATIVSFFLWNSGTPVQRSLKGLLSAILYQILSMNGEPIPNLLMEQPELSRKVNHSHWSEEELESALAKCISTSPQPLCIFLDGLDEIDRDEGCFSVVDLIERLRSNTAAKFCVSSRPEAEFQDAFGGYPKLRLQDLTAKDISNFVNDFIQKHFQSKVVDGDEPVQRQKLINTILGRADGVFLWVHLVLESLRRGRVRFDSYEQLSERIIRFPRELEELYKKSWERHGEDESLYRKQAAQYFKLALEARNYPAEIAGSSLSLLEFAVASDDAVQNDILDGKSLPSVKSLVDETEKSRRRIESRCGGFLEVWSHNRGPSPADGDVLSYTETATKNFLHQFIIPLSAYVDPESGGAESLPQGSSLAALWNAAYHDRVEFIHRTAADFLLNTDWGRDIIDSDPATYANIRTNIFRSRLVHALFFTFPPYPNSDNLNKGLHNFSFELQVLRQDIPNELGENLLVQLEDVYEKLFDRVYTIDYTITQLRLQIQNGQFGGSYYKILCDFSALYTVQSLQCLYTRDEIKSKRFQVWRGSDSMAIEGIKVISNACLQIIANYASNVTDLSDNVSWPAIVPKFPVLRRTVQSSELLGHTFADIFFVIWVLLDARSFLRAESTSAIISFLLSASHIGMRDTLKRSIEKRKDVYAHVKNFKEALLYSASYFKPQEWRNDETICWLLEEGADPNGPSYPNGLLLTSLERFLLSILNSTPQSTEASIGHRIVATIRAYINAGANLDRVICVCRNTRRSGITRMVRYHDDLGFRYISGDDESVFDIMIESNICQLIQDAISFIKDLVAEEDLDIQGGLDNLITGNHKGYKKVLCVSKVARATAFKLTFNWAAVSTDESDQILKLLDSERVARKWSNQAFEAELKSLLGRILDTGEELGNIDAWLSERGHTPTTRFRKPGNKVKPFYQEIFPDLAYDGAEDEKAITITDFLYKSDMIWADRYPLRY